MPAILEKNCDLAIILFNLPGGTLLSSLGSTAVVYCEAYISGCTFPRSDSRFDYAEVLLV